MGHGEHDPTFDETNPLDGSKLWNLRRAKTIKGWIETFDRDTWTEAGRLRYVAADLLGSAIEDLTWKTDKPPKSKYMVTFYRERVRWALDAFEWLFLTDRIRSCGTFAWCCEQLGDRPDFRARVIFDLYREDVLRTKTLWKSYGCFSWRRMLQPDPRFKNKAA